MQSESPLPGPQAGTLALGASSVMRLAHDSSFCGRSQGGISPLRRRGGGMKTGEACDRPATPSVRLTCICMVSNVGRARRLCQPP